jgi:circadian clock protein KaiC
MRKPARRPKAPLAPLPKCPTGIQGLDEITAGGLPRGRPVLVCGDAGCGKTLLGMEFLVRGATRFREPGVCLSFEETDGELIRNLASLGFDLQALIARKQLAIDHVFIERSEIEETGEYDLEGLFVRLGHAIDSIGARRVLLDSLESLFGGLSNESILRAELRRLFRWLKMKGVTAVITGERGSHTLTRHGLEEYVSDCVILLDHRVQDSVFTRSLRVVKYRGSVHGTNQYPFLIDEHGISVLPVTSLELGHSASRDRVSTGVAGLDAMMGGKGFFRGSSVLVSGTAGTGKTSLSAHFVDAACRRGERVVYFAFEESEQQIIRNMHSLGLRLETWVAKGLLRFQSVRPTHYGLETHLVRMHEAVDEFKPRVVAVDPITSLVAAGSASETRSMLLRLIDSFKRNQVTAVLTTLSSPAEPEETEVCVSSLVDTWILLRDVESGGERNRTLFILKSRGMPHSSQVREFLLTSRGIELRDAYLGPGGVLTGSARLVQEARERGEEQRAAYEAARKRLLLQGRGKALEARIAALQVQLENQKHDLDHLLADERARLAGAEKQRAEIARSRAAYTAPAAAPNGRGARR